MKKPKLMKTVLLLTFLLAGTSSLFPQRQCSKPKVYVSVGYADDPFLRRLIYDDYVSKGYQIHFDNEKEYLKTIMDDVIRELKVRSGDVEIIPLEERVFFDDLPETPEEENTFQEYPSGEYHLQYLLGLMARDEGTPGPDGTVHPDYQSMLLLGDADIDGVYVRVSSFKYPDLFGSINHIVSDLCKGNLRNVLDKYEATHFNALREGEMTMEVLSPGFVSPEPEEQKITIRVTASDCRNNSGKGTNMWFPNEKDRGFYNPENISFQARIGNTWWVKTVEGGIITVEYQLKRGETAFRESLNVELACRGNKRTSKDIFFTAKTLLVEVVPEKTFVAPGEKTRVFVRLFKVDDKGVKEPVKGRTLDLTISGIEDGKISPSSKVTTNEKGEGILEYTAGQHDKKVHIEASYNPLKFETTFRGSADIGKSIYQVTVDLDLASSFVPDGSMSIAKLKMHVDFDRVVIEPGNRATPVSLLGDIDADEGRGRFLTFELNKAWTEGDNFEQPKFIKKPPESFGATLTLHLEEDELNRILQQDKKGTSIPPDKMKLSFFTDMDHQEIEWGCSTGSAAAGFYEFQVKFDVPWSDLLAGKPATVKVPYATEDPNEKGTWTIQFKPIER